jgi:hypothetical protein
VLDFVRLCDCFTLGEVDGCENVLKWKVWMGELGGNVVGGGHAIISCVLLRCNAASELVDCILRSSLIESVEVGKRGCEQGRESMGEGFGAKVFSGESCSSGMSSRARSARYSSSSSFLLFEPLCHRGDGTQLAASLSSCDAANSAI